MATVSRAVIYLYNEASVGHVRNLGFFLRHAMPCADTHFVFVLVGGAGTKVVMPEAGPLCSLVHRPNDDTRFGAWAAGLAAVDLDTVQHIVFVSGAGFGPCLPGYRVGAVNWTQLFCSRLQGDVHCVGPFFQLQEPPYAWATDRECLRALQEDGLFLDTCRSSVQQLVIARGWHVESFVHEEGPLHSTQLMFVHSLATGTAQTYQYHYGSAAHKVDVTLRVQDMLDRDPCVADVAVTNQALGGDPDVGTPKHLWLMLDGSVPMSLVPEGALCQVAVHLPCGTFRDYTPLLQGMVGLEIGGPSLAVADLGVYTAPARLDNADFSPSTLWSSSVDGAAYECAGKTCPGTTHVVDAVALATKLPLGYYDFVVSSHVLEHLVNPLKALWHMSAVTKAGGFALHVLPWKVATFDHCRRTTPWKELLAHYREDRDETDVGDHLDEVRAHYDLARDPKAGTWDEFLDRCSRHAENRALHVHVFDFELLQTCLEFMGYRVLDLQLVAPLHQVILAQKVRAAPPPT